MPAPKKTSRKSKQRKDESCEGKKCYYSLDHTETVEYPYAKIKDKKQCLKPTPKQRASAVLQAQRVFENFAKVYCKAGGYGDDQCDKPYKCKPEITGWKSRITGWRTGGKDCIVEVEISGHIECKCLD